MMTSQAAFLILLLECLVDSKKLNRLNDASALMVQLPRVCEEITHNPLVNAEVTCEDHDSHIRILLFSDSKCTMAHPDPSVAKELRTKLSCSATCHPGKVLLHDSICIGGFVKPLIPKFCMPIKSNPMLRAELSCESEGSEIRLHTYDDDKCTSVHPVLPSGSYSSPVDMKTLTGGNLKATLSCDSKICANGMALYNGELCIGGNLPTTTTTTSYNRKSLSLETTFAGIAYAELVSKEEIKKAFEKSVAQSIITMAGFKIEPADVQLALSNSGGTIVDVTIEVGGFPMLADVASMLEPKQLAAFIQGRLTDEVDDLPAVTEGLLHVSCSAAAVPLRQVTGRGWCADEEGADGTARRVMPEKGCDTASKACFNDPFCVAYSCGSHTNVLYTGTDCTLDCENTAWLRDPNLIVRAAHDQLKEHDAWDTATCYVLNREPLFSHTIVTTKSAMALAVTLQTTTTAPPVTTPIPPAVASVARMAANISEEVTESTPVTKTAAAVASAAGIPAKIPEDEPEMITSELNSLNSLAGLAGLAGQETRQKSLPLVVAESVAAAATRSHGVSFIDVLSSALDRAGKSGSGI
mmetsp:Transcript_17838/g.31238  ORF Transcript_17838/g.31238 Transcript_17838/m.31238 type:complete len:581 (+) Transcript_17838:100-1842(+)|eukprot:CAMPEP_0197652796 /NCGR_PEP_ID=MMETSP1338-20131121/34664_1 /TAXON_ID=43686 ORGANISM="Pelagodinium beii, Strain RCC1491" /NCGR_SAMPLE_ID=MMETSP1338 /ASSEMBLY_ACC=CAM_ASM_000754 /LENGTH=580 /DNA_ID=CAMNT_0043227741 /DNA_START=88 /DNA_END=1830 /DNA_ORIENTATION=+